jgi:hypothetical protein
MADFIKGEGLILYIYETTWKPIACLTSNSITRTKSVIETQTKCDPGVIIRGQGTKSYEVPFEGIYINTTDAVGGDLTKLSHDALMPIFDLTTITQWKMDTGLSDTPAYFGEAIFTGLDLVAAAGDEWASFSGTLSGSGEIVTVDPNA